MGGVAAGEHRAKIRLGLDGRLNEADFRPGGDGFELGWREAGAQAVETRHRGEDLTAAGGEKAFEIGRDATADVDEQSAVRLRAHRGLELGQGGEIGRARLAFEQIDQLRVEPGLGWGAPTFFRQQGGDLALGAFAEALAVSGGGT